jgi:hypothetical protein
MFMQIIKNPPECLTGWGETFYRIYDGISRYNNYTSACPVKKGMLRAGLMAAV